MFNDLREYLTELKNRNMLVEVEDSVDPDLEIAHILREVCYANGPAVLFKNIKNCNTKAVGNLFGSIDRINMVLREDDIYRRLEYFESSLRVRFRGIQEIVKSISEFSRIGKALPRKVSSGPVHEVEWKNIDLTKLPAIRQWPKEPSRFFTMGITFIMYDERINFGYYRLQVVDERRLIMHWMPWRKSREFAELWRSDEVPVAIVFGVDPITMLMASVPIPSLLDKLIITGLLRERGLDLVQGKTVDVLYPANSELVIEGIVKMRDLLIEGPFGDHVGFYSPSLYYPIVEVRAVYSRDDPIIPVTVTGKPLLEDGYMMLFGEKVVKRLLKILLPEVVDFHILPHGLGYVYVVSIRKKYPGHAKRVMFMLWSLIPVLGKMVIVVDHDINIRDLNQVTYSVAANVDPQRDVLIVPGYATEELDPSTPIIGYGSKLGIDATRKLPEEYDGKNYPEEVEPSREVEVRVKHIIDKILRKS